MKKYSSTTRGNSRPIFPKQIKLAGALAVGLILLGSLFSQWFSYLSAAVLYPFEQTAFWFKTSDKPWPSYWRNRSELIAEVDSLKRELSGLNASQLSLRRLQEENNQLRRLTESNLPGERIVARVMAGPSTLRYDLLQIDHGSKSGVVVGAPVFAGVDAVIGVVVHVLPNTAFVDLLTSSGFEATAFVLGPNVFATLEGMGGGVARVKLPQGLLMQEGDAVILPSVDSGVYGTVVSVENLPTQPEQYGYVTPATALSSLTYVSVAREALVQPEVADIDSRVQSAVRSQFRIKNQDGQFLGHELNLLLSTTTATTGTEVE